MTHFRIDIQFNLFLQLYEYDQNHYGPGYTNLVFISTKQLSRPNPKNPSFLIFSSRYSICIFYNKLNKYIHFILNHPRRLHIKISMPNYSFIVGHYTTSFSSTRIKAFYYKRKDRFLSCFVLGTDDKEDIQLFVWYDSISAFLYLNFSCIEWIQQVMTFFVGWILDHFDCKQGQVIGYNTRIRQKEFKIIVYLSRCSQNQLNIILLGSI